MPAVPVIQFSALGSLGTRSNLWSEHVFPPKDTRQGHVVPTDPCSSLKRNTGREVRLVRPCSFFLRTPLINLSCFSLILVYVNTTTFYNQQNNVKRESNLLPSLSRGSSRPLNPLGQRVGESPRVPPP